MSGPVTPHAASSRTSLPPPTTGSATPALPPPSTSSLPPPATFDILPDLHRLLTRLLATAAQPPAASTAPSATPSQPTAAGDEDGPLDPKNLVNEAQKLRNKIHRAQRAVLALPDIDRTIEDQEDEIEELERGIEKLKGALQGLGRPVAAPGSTNGAKVKAEDEDKDTSMTG